MFFAFITCIAYHTTLWAASKNIACGMLSSGRRNRMRWECGCDWSWTAE